MRTKGRVIELVLFGGLIALFFTYTTLLAVGNPLCCADDASFAVISKNLANGLGYTFTLNYFGPDYAAHPFPPGVGTGPTLILTAALLIKIFGALAWMPGEATVVLCTLYLIGIGSQLRLILGRQKYLVVLVAFVLVAFLCTAYDFYYWSAELGEAPATLSVIFGYLLWVNRSTQPWKAFAAGLLVALGFLTKELAAIYVVALVVFALAALLRKPGHDSGRGLAFRDMALLLVGLAAPVCVFEIYKLSSLGTIHAYVTNWSEHLQFIRRQGISDGHVASWDHFRERSAALFGRFTLPASILFAGFAIAFWGAILEKSKNREIILLFLAGSALNAAYWYFYSVGWPRYATLFVLIWVFVLCYQLLLKRPVGVLIAILLLCVVFESKSHVPYMWNHFKDGIRNADSALSSERKVLLYLDQHNGVTPVFTGWWAQVANLEYLSKSAGHFDGYQLSSTVKQPSFLLVTYSHFPLKDPPFVEFVKNCSLELNEGEYDIYRCIAHSP